MLRDLKARGIEAPRLLMADGNAAIWGAVRQVWPEAGEQRCWHACLPQREQSEAKDLLRAVVYATSQAEAVKAREAFARRYRPWYPKAVDVLEDDWERMVAFYDFPEDHWKHLRTTNVVESPFAAVRLRTSAAKRFKRVESATALIWKLLLVAEKRFRTGPLTVGKATPYLFKLLAAAPVSAVVWGASGGAAFGGLLVAFRTLSDGRAFPGDWWPRWCGTGPLALPPMGTSGTCGNSTPCGPGYRPFCRRATYGYLGHMWELYAMWTWVPAFLSASALARAARMGAAAPDQVGGSSRLFRDRHRWHRLRLGRVDGGPDRKGWIRQPGHGGERDMRAARRFFSSGRAFGYYSPWCSCGVCSSSPIRRSSVRWLPKSRLSRVSAPR